jgi:hypothetical protein
MRPAKHRLPAKFRQALACHPQGQPECALLLCQEILVTNPRDAAVHFHRGREIKRSYGAGIRRTVVDENQFDLSVAL